MNACCQFSNSIYRDKEFLFSVFGYPNETPSLVFDIFLNAPGSSFMGSSFLEQRLVIEPTSSRLTAVLFSLRVVCLCGLKRDFGSLTKQWNFNRQQTKLTNKEASTVLCSVVKHTRSGRARKKCRGKHETQSSVFPHFLSALPLPEFSNQIFFSKGVKVASAVY